MAATTSAEAKIGFVPYGTRGNCLGCNGKTYYESSVDSSGWSTIRLEDLKKKFASMCAHQALHNNPMVGIRLTWSIPAFSKESPVIPPFFSLLKKFRLAAIWPMDTYTDEQVVETPLFSNVTPDRAPVWAIMCVWGCSRPSGFNADASSGPGAYDAGDDAVGGGLLARSGKKSMTPMSDGSSCLIRLKASARHARNLQNSPAPPTALVSEDVVNPPLASPSKANPVSFAENVSRRIKTSRLRLIEMAGEIASDAFFSANSPLTRMALSIAQWLGSLSDADDETCRLILDATWTAFCSELRARFEMHDADLYEDCIGDDLIPNSAMCEAHQKVSLVRFCVKELASSSEIEFSDDLLGRKRKLDFKLTSKTAEEEDAYEPETQPANPWLDREEDLSLVADKDVRFELLSPCLISDMRAFKAANPKCSFVDFLKWFSPRDVVHGTGDVPEDTASSRMSIDNNFWTTAWKAATPLVAKDQKPLFDPIVFGEKAMHWLEGLDRERILNNILEEITFGLKELGTASNEFGEFASVEFVRDLENAMDETSVLSAFAPIEARNNRVTTLKAYQAAGTLSSFIVEELIAGDGVATFLNESNKDEIEELRVLLKTVDRNAEKRPDKREYVIYDEVVKKRLYASASVGELRFATVT